MGRVDVYSQPDAPDRLDQQPAPLHSNPGPPHVFTDAAGHFTGLIDFSGVVPPA